MEHWQCAVRGLHISPTHFNGMFTPFFNTDLVLENTYMCGITWAHRIAVGETMSET